MRKIISIILISFLFSSCAQELSEKEKDWNPYKLNEVLIFESSNQRQDTIIVDEIVDNAISSGPTPELFRETHLIVYAEKLRMQGSKFSQINILEINSGTLNKPAKIGFFMQFDNVDFASWFKIEEINGLSEMTVRTKAGIFEDVIKLNSGNSPKNEEESFQFIYWSKKNGYIRLEREDGFKWELIKKYVP